MKAAITQGVEFNDFVLKHGFVILTKPAVVHLRKYLITPTTYRNTHNPLHFKCIFCAVQTE